MLTGSALEPSLDARNARPHLRRLLTGSFRASDWGELCEAFAVLGSGGEEEFFGGAAQEPEARRPEVSLQVVQRRRPWDISSWCRNSFPAMIMFERCERTIMHFRVFYFALFCLGTTIGVLHALSLSPISSAVLQILGSIGAGGIAILAGTEKGGPTPDRLRQALPALSAVMFSVLVGYWTAWWATKEYMITQYMLPQNMPDLSAQQELDAYRLIGVARALGVPRKVIEARVIELSQMSTQRPLTPQEEVRIIARLALEAGNCRNIAPDRLKSYLKEVEDLGKDAEKLIVRFAGNNWVQKYLEIRINLLLLPLPLDAQSFKALMTQSNCKHNELAIRQFEALDQSLFGGVTTIGDEIKRLLASASELSRSAILRDPEKENENF